ncbi:zinc ribbon domain-containing protein [Pannus brasiliensis CCIBt3594]|uniref:Zinc ribbon domain-containing protein n=1 Tax=Pannus brasiliensis CCIBt3594 TaxID=1427578 RepID=A0AAW9QHH6_9CHRO
MPLYDYRCPTCGDFEAWRSISELDNPLSCPNCSEIATRVFSPPLVNLNSGRFPSKTGEPRLVRSDREPAKPRVQSANSGRPWMISHAPPRY